MTTYSTQNPLGSADPRDLYDNAENLDEAVNDLNSETWVDRFGVERITIQGALNRLNDVIIAGGQIFESEEAGREYAQDGQYYYSVSDDPEVSKILWRRVDADNSEFVADEPSAELIDRVLQESATLVDLIKTYGAEIDFYSVPDADVEPLLVAENGGTLIGSTREGDLLLPYETDFYSVDQIRANAALTTGDGVPIAAIDNKGQSIFHWTSDFFSIGDQRQKLAYAFVDVNNVAFNAWDVEGRTVIGGAGPAGGGGENVVTPQQFGVVTGAGGDMSSGFQAAYDYLESIGGGTLYIPNGVYTFSNTVYVPGDVETAGQSEDGAILQANVDHSFDTLTLLDFPGTPDNQKVVAMFATKYAADDGTDRYTGNHTFRTLTIDWNNAPAGGTSSMGPLVSSRTSSGMIDRCKFINTLDGSLPAPGDELRGGALIFAFSENWNVFKAAFGAGDYYTVRPNLLCKNITFEDCLFDVDKPTSMQHQRHIIEINRPSPMASALRDRFGDDQTRDIFINRCRAYANQVNDYFSSHAGTGLHVTNCVMAMRESSNRRGQMFLRAHGGAKDAFFRNNVMTAISATSSNAVMAAVVSDNTVHNCIFTGNKYEFNAEGLTNTGSRACVDFGTVGRPSHNVIASGNIINIKNYPNVPLRVIAGAGTNFAVSHNIITFEDPSEPIDENGPIPIDLEVVGDGLIESPNIVSGEHSGLYK